MSSRLYAAWEHIFAVKQFDVSQNLHYISAKEIKAISGEEPRLMAKFDTSLSLPPIFTQHGYFLLPVSNARYAIVRGNGFHTLETVPEAKAIVSRVKFNLAAMHRNTSESQYLDYSHIAGVIEDMIGRGTLYANIRGREGSGSFSFHVGSTKLDVTAAQIEVDLGLEGEDCIVLLEAKSKTPADFIIRQLYYPYQRFTSLTPAKKIIPVFFTYEKLTQTYNFWVYEFRDPDYYNSIHLIRTHAYKIITANAVSTADIIPLDSVSKEIVPQANNLDTVLALIFKVKEGVNTALAVATYFEFDTRQASYYREAAEALGFIELHGNTYQLTPSGDYLTGLDVQQRNLYFSRAICGFTLMKNSLSELEAKHRLSRDDVEAIIASNSNLSGSTIKRRASSLYAWLKWVGLHTGAFTIDETGILRLVDSSHGNHY